MVKKGAEAIDEWRKKHPKEKLNLSGADLLGANLSVADLSAANFLGADLSVADLFDAHLLGTNLSVAALSAANFLGADLSVADLFDAHLLGANLSRAHLSGAKLSAAYLAGANLTDADLSWTNLSQANLDKANLTSANLSRTALADCDLSQCTGLETVHHGAPSTIGVDTLIKTYRGAGNRLTPELETFFLGAGVPRELLATLPQILAEVKYYSAFVSYGEPDLKFAERLVNDLKAKGVSCWLYSMDATPGERTWKEIGQKRREAEKMVVLCSLKSLLRPGVRKEIEEQKDEDPNKIILVSLDHDWQHPSFTVMGMQSDLKPFLMERNYADFSNPSAYEESLERLLKGLERKDRPQG